MSRFNLPDITFADKSAQQIETDVVNSYQQITGQTLADADPRRLFIRAVVLLLAQQRVMIDSSAKQNLLTYATGIVLDHIGAARNTPRLQPTAATTTVRFTLSAPQTQIVNAGTRATAGDGVFFATTADVTIPDGQTYVDIEMACTVTGVIGNGYVAGQINQLVDPLPWVQSVSNTTESEGGADLEDDDSYAERIRQAPESFSVAGPTGAYQYWAKTANPSIIDVSVRTPSPGVVEIRPLLEGGEIPGQEILDSVLTICSDRNIRPLTDNVQALAPESVSYDLNLTYWINTSDASIASVIQSQVNQAISDYQLWQKSKLGRDIDPSELITRIKNAGAKRVAVTLPAYQALDTYQVAQESANITNTYGGLEDD